MKLLHYGLQRSGTNFLESLLRRTHRVSWVNSNRDRRSLLQKHVRLYDNKAIIPEPQYHNDLSVETFESFERQLPRSVPYYLVISKDPYSWFLSYTEWAMKCGWPPAAHHYIEAYNLFYGKFLELAEQTDRILFVRYIDLLADQEATLAGLENRMGLARRGRISRVLHGSNRVAQSPTFNDDRRRYYLESQFLERYEYEELAKLNDRLDPLVADALGYDILEASRAGN